MAVVCTPNNPTGEAAEPDRLRAFAARCRESNTELLVDEAFLGYTDRPSLAGTEGVVVARSLTKLYGLPGLRAGYAVATGDRLGDLQTARRAWSLSTPAARVGAHCLRDAAFVVETRNEVARERTRLREALATRFAVYPSDAPFLLIDTGEQPVDEVVEGARERGVAVRDATTFRSLDSHVRVAVKSPDENDRLLEALDVRD
jgi:histidinol-phosphate/aromatic aminotransferase/cobyric acid decarboxylase-like protein